MNFQLHPQLQADTDLIGEFPLCLALLAKQEIGPWVILVPKVVNKQELHQLTVTDQHQFLLESQTVFKSLEQLYNPKKLNLAALGNMVPQLHIHHIARFETDVAWPNPIWGNTQGTLRDQENTHRVLTQLCQQFCYLDSTFKITS